MAEIFKSLDLVFCAQASISSSKSSMRDVLVALSKTSSPAEGEYRDEGIDLEMGMGLRTADYPCQCRIDF